MAGIDKCYLDKYEDYLALKEWAKGKSFITPRGCKVYPEDYFYSWNEEDFTFNGEPRSLPIFNSPTYVDNYLYHNCPLKFIQDWLEDRYLSWGYSKGDAPEIQNELHLPEYEPCTGVTILQKGYRAKDKWYVDIDPIDNDYFWYNDFDDFWVLPGEVDVYTTSSACLTCSMKALIRKIIKKWKLPKGVTLQVMGIHGNNTWILRTK